MTGEDNRIHLQKVMGTSISLGLVVFLLLFGYLPSSYAQSNSTAATAHINANPLVYHLSSSDPWRASGNWLLGTKLKAFLTHITDSEHSKIFKVSSIAIRIWAIPTATSQRQTFLDMGPGWITDKKTSTQKGIAVLTILSAFQQPSTWAARKILQHALYPSDRRDLTFY